ncbi:MAG: hypothetical protein WDW38_007733 [Sanguina aurantia]
MQTHTAPNSAALHESHNLFSRSDASFTAARDSFCNATVGYQRNVENIRQQEFTRLRDVAYLDCAGAALYSEKQVQAATNQLQDTLFCNPHSQNGPGSASAEAEALLRLRTLQMCHASGQEYDVILTSGATASLKLVAECFPWSASSRFEYSRTNHNSVLGIRAVALEAGATVQAVELEPACPAGSVNAFEGAQGHARSTAGACHIRPSGAAMSYSNHSDCLTEGQRSRSDSSARWSVPQRLDQQPPVVYHTPTVHAHDTSGGQQQPDSLQTRHHMPHHLFAYPPECNFSGARTHGSVVKQVHDCRGNTTASPSLESGCGNSCHDGAGEALLPTSRGAQDVVTASSSSSSSSSSAGCVASLHGRRHGDEPPLPQSHLVSAAGVGGVKQQGQWLVLMDAAKACSTQPPDLSRHHADFVTVSFYKIFGYPTGLGALLVRKRVMPLLRKAYFGGGTLSMVLAAQDHMVRRPGHSGFEDGTLPYTSISAALHGFAFIDRLGGFPTISLHARCLADHLASQLSLLRHANGSPVCVLYGRPATTPPTMAHTTRPSPAQPAGCRLLHHHPPSSSTPPASPAGESNGPTVAFNLLDEQGGAVGHAEVARLAGLHGILLRAGCFCNPGACEKYLGLQPEDVIAQHAAGHVCWDDVDLIGGRPTGALRASLGHVSTFHEVHALLTLLSRYFVSSSVAQPASSPAHLPLSNFDTLQQNTEYPAANAAAAAAPKEGTVGVDSASHVNIVSPAAAAAAAHVIDVAIGLLSVKSVAAGSTASTGHPCSHQSSTPASTASDPGSDNDDSDSGLPDDALDPGFVSCEEDLAPGGGCIDPALVGNHAHAFQVHHEVGRLEAQAAVSAPESPSEEHGTPTTVAAAPPGRGMHGLLTHIYLYPIKSCAPQQVSRASQSVVAHVQPTSVVG